MVHYHIIIIIICHNGIFTWQSLTLNSIFRAAAVLAQQSYIHAWIQEFAAALSGSAA